MRNVFYKNRRAWGMIFFIIMSMISPMSWAEDSSPAIKATSAKAVSSKAVSSVAKREQAVKKVRSKAEEDYQLKKGDKISITIYPEDEYVRGGENLITEDGDIRIHSVGKVNVVDKTIVDAERAITEVLQDYFVDPAVVIELLESEQMAVVILGQVRRPGTYPFPVGVNQFSLMEAISLAGGFSEVANIKKITITSKTPDGKTLRRRANAEEILQGKEDDVNLSPNDIVHVSESLF